jgi:hypothetical protein
MSAAFGRERRIALLAGALLLALSCAAAAAAPVAAKAPQRFLSPASGGAAPAAVFGAGALEVSVFSLQGRLVFRQAQNGGAAIVWNCRDAGGRIVPTGVYIARIRTADSGVVYQSFAVVK